MYRRERNRAHARQLDRLLEEFSQMSTVEELTVQLDILKRGYALQQRQIDDQRDEVDFLIKSHLFESSKLKNELTTALGERNDYMYRLQDLQRDYAELWNLARETGICGSAISLTGPQASSLASSLIGESDTSKISLDSPDTPPETPAVCLRIIAEARKARRDYQAYYNKTRQSTDLATCLPSMSRTPNPLLNSIRTRPTAPGPVSPQPAMQKPIPRRPMPRFPRRKSISATDAFSPSIDLSLLSFAN